MLWAQSTTKDYIRAEQKRHSISKSVISQVITSQVMFFLGSTCNALCRVFETGAGTRGLNVYLNASSAWVHKFRSCHCSEISLTDQTAAFNTVDCSKESSRLPFTLPGRNILCIFFFFFLSTHTAFTPSALTTEQQRFLVYTWMLPPCNFRPFFRLAWSLQYVRIWRG